MTAKVLFLKAVEIVTVIEVFHFKSHLSSNSKKNAEVASL